MRFAVGFAIDVHFLWLSKDEPTISPHRPYAIQHYQTYCFPVSKWVTKIPVIDEIHHIFAKLAWDWLDSLECKQVHSHACNIPVKTVHMVSTWGKEQAQTKPCTHTHTNPRLRWRQCAAALVWSSVNPLTDSFDLEGNGCTLTRVKTDSGLWSAVQPRTHAYPRSPLLFQCHLWAWISIIWTYKLTNRARWDIYGLSSGWCALNWCEIQAILDYPSRSDLASCSKMSVWFRPRSEVKVERQLDYDKLPWSAGPWAF